MRKLVLFLLLLGAGLLLLYWLDRRRAAPGPVAPVEPQPPVQEPARDVQGFQPFGPTQFVQYDEETRFPVVRVESEDTVAEGGVDLLTGVTLELFDPAVENAVQVRLRAERARAKRRPASGALQPEWEDRIELEGVQAEILSGLPLAPLTFETETVVLEPFFDPLTRRVQTDEAFSARSAELVLTGRGFDWSMSEERLEIRSNGRVEVPREGEAPATFTADEGRMQVRRDEGPAGPLTLEAWEGAVLVPGAESPGELAAEHVTLRARTGEAPGQRLAIETLDADGDVDWTSGKARFQGQRLSARFAPEGRLDGARLDGEPRAELALELPSSVLPSVDPEEQRLVVLEGQDALDITWQDGGYALHVESLPAPPGQPPARVPSVVTRDFRLQSASSIDGWLSEDQKTARFRAGGGVVVTSGGAELETAEFEVEIAPDESGETLLVGTASGGARLEGTLPARSGDTAPRPFTLTSPDGLKIERSARGWRVIESTRVEVSVAEPDGFRARAQRVSDFVVPQSRAGELVTEGLRFLAQGAVEVELDAGRFGAGSFGGEELEVLALAPVPHFVLRGTRESKAFFRGEPGEASALEVERTGDTLHARGEVTGSAEISPDGAQEPVRASFAGDELTLDRSESPELLPDERLRTLRVLVEGHVQCSVDAEDQTLVVRCARFSAENRSRLVEGAAEPVELGSLFIAEGDVHADFVTEDDDLSVDCERFEIERGAGDVATGFRQLTANGSVRFQGRFGGDEELDVGGECEILVYSADRRGSLEGGPHGRVLIFGRAPEQKTPYRMTAERVDFEMTDDEVVRLLALRPQLRMLGLRATAEHFTADDQKGVVLSGDVRVTGTTSAHVPFTLDADEVVLVGRRARPEGADPLEPEAEARADDQPSIEDQLDSLSASGDVDFRLSDGLRARGERLAVRRASGLLRLEGTPATFELGATRLETEWVELDPVLQVLVATGRGRVIAQDEATGAVPLSADSWTLDFLSVSTLLELDSVVLVVQEPLFRTAQFTSALRASWAILWLNREPLQDVALRDELLENLQETFARLKTLPEDATPLEKLALFRSAELSGLLREIYFEGPVEVLAEGELLARSDAIYLDVASQHGWLARATVNLGGQFLGQRQEKLIVRTDWLRLSSDGSLRADRATVTSCTFDDPHVSVVTGDLRIEPIRQPDRGYYLLRLKDNRVELYDKLRIPLPTIEIATDERLKPILPTLSLANSARFGTLFGFAFTRPADNVGEVFDRLARPDEEEQQAPAAPGETPAKPRSDVDAHYQVDGSYLGSRGGLLDLGLEIEAKEDYWFDLYVGLALDDGRDRGFVRVDEDDRGSLRNWIRSRAHFNHGKSVWSFSFSDQSDPAVQSEFYEGQFLRYERSENYVQWRRSSDENFAQGSLEARTDDFRSEVEELPSLSAYRGRTPLLRLGPLALLHTGDIRAEYLRRRAGGEPRSPFESRPSFEDTPEGDFGGLDGLGDHEVLRADTSHALELPVPLGAGWKLTPFLAGRASAWNEGVEQGDEPTRLVAEGGARLAAAFWKRAGGGKRHQIAPFVEYRSELAREDEDGTPVVYDALDRVLSGDFLRLGSRGRFDSDAEGALLDLDLVGAYASDRSDGRPDGWLPLEVIARLLLEPLGHEFEVFHDGRYDLEERQTAYSLVSLGTHLGEEWGVQLSHQRGRDVDGQALFEAASVSALYRWTEKWEFEGRESFSLLEDEELDTKFVVRRYGHDIVFEFESSVREGEGTSVGVSVKPRFGYDPPRIGYVSW